VVGETVQQQAEGIGSEAVAAQTISDKTILEFLNAILTLLAIIIEGKKGNGCGQIHPGSACSAL
jgi:hypothetical protein